MQSYITSEAAYQKLLYQKLRMKTSDSDKSSESRNVRRTFSATMIGIHHLLKIQKAGETTLSSGIMTLVLLYELITRFGRIFLPKINRTQMLPDMVKDDTTSSWRNLTASIQFKDAPPSTINRS
ncbi:hypothetical protein QL285_058093 [Trifolium repens]|nr:hypothetical protein QL285_058093 [Trifolium repens]